MRIGLLIYGSLDTLTGGYLYDKHLVAQLHAGGDEIVIFSLPWRNYVRHLGDNFSAELWLKLKDAEIDLLIQDELTHPSALWLNRRLQKAANYPIVSLIHLLRFTEWRPAWQNRLYRWLEKAYLRSVDGLIYNSQDSRRHVERLIGGGKPSVVAYPGRDHLPASSSTSSSTFSSPKLTRQPLHIISVGNVVRRKGLHILMAALAQLPASAGQWQLTVIGGLEFEPAYSAGIQAAIRKNGWEERVKLLGALPNEQVAPYLRQADLFVMASQYEGFGIVYLEAMGAKLPVIASTAGAAGEIIRHGQEGWLVEPEQPRQLARWLEWALGDRVQLGKMGEAAYKRFFDFPTWAENAGIIRKFLYGLTADDRP